MKTFLLFPAFLLLIITDIFSASAVKLNTTKLQAAKEVDCSKCPLSTQEMNSADQLLIKFLQSQAFAKEIKASGKGPMQEKPMDCEELKENGVTKSGKYTIYPRNRLASCQSIEVYCDMETDGGGWTVIQRRGQYGNGEDYFNKKWSYYKQGFGNLDKEFWLGNEKIYSITNQGQYAVRMEMEHENGTSAFTVYENFWIENEDAKYKLHISDASGPGGDAISNDDGYVFYTVDQPNRSGDDQSTRSGGWWRNGKGTSSLNGLNLYKTDKEDSSDGIIWVTFGDNKNSLKATEIKVRKRNFY